MGAEDIRSSKMPRTIQGGGVGLTPHIWGRGLLLSERGGGWDQHMRTKLLMRRRVKGSGWCQFETKMLIKEGICQRKLFIIIVHSTMCPRSLDQIYEVSYHTHSKY